MLKKEKYRFVIQYFSEHFPEAETELHYENPFQLLIAVILSAQCTDKRINMVTPALFERFPTPESLAAATFDEVYSLIKSVSYPNNKTKHLIGMAQKLVQEFGGQVPEKVEDLQKLPGVGRKTANVVASVIYNQPTFAVDTHVFRVSRRIGLAPAKAKTPLEVEKHLIKNFPKYIIPKAHHWLILHGRYICKARRPLCNECGLTPICSYYQKLLKQRQSKEQAIMAK